MSSILLKNLRLGLANLAVKKSDRTVEVAAVKERKKIDPVSHTMTDIVEGYTLDFYAISGIQSVKLSLDLQQVVEQINSALERGAIVRVSFGSPSTLDAHCYCMVNNGVLMQGVTAKAKVVEIAEIIEQDEDFDIEL